MSAAILTTDAMGRCGQMQWNSKTRLLCSAGDNNEWYGEAQMAFELLIDDGKHTPLVLVRRYKEYHGRRCRYIDCLDMPRLQWDTTGFKGRGKASYQCITLDAINRLVLMQKDPSPEHSQESFICNNLIRMHQISA